MEKICVAVRVRPLVSSDSVNGSFWKVHDNRISLHKIHGTPLSNSSYAFDHVFDESCSNSSVYEILTKDIILAALNGFNGTAFAYGQTSSGKTFTMNGCETDPGVIPRAVKDIFSKIETMTEREFLIRVSYMEIYNEEINDLLVVENQKLQIHESLERGVFVAGLREEIVNNAEQVLDLLKVGEVNRHFGETNMNVRSSRSHTIFRMVIESKGKDSDSSDDSSISDIVRVSVLNLVDLAGSERIAKTGADGVRLKEGKYINKSLMILGNVINKLSEGSKNRGHIPYRDSKLTRILQPALGGNAKTSIICTVAPEEDHIEETKGTLQFASRAKRITNCVQVNEILTDAALLKRQQLEIEELRKKLQGSHAGVLEQEVLKLRNDLLKYEMERGKLEMELEEERKSRNQWISEQQMKIENSSTTSFSVSDCGTNDNQGPRYLRRGLIEEYSDINSTSQGDIFKSPCLKTASAFVVKRSRNSTLPDSSPSLPEAFSNVADEDMWLKMNNGYVADLDSLQITPTRNIQSFPLSDTTPGCISQTAKYEREVQDLRRQLELANEKINELERKNSEEVPSSKQLLGENPDNQQETPLIQELPMRLSEYVENYKDSFEEVLSVMQRFALDGKVSTDKMLSTMSEIGANLFATLESHFSTENYAAIREQQKEFHERMNNLITSLELSESSITGNQKRTALCSCEHKGSGLGGETESAYSKDALNERCESLERELQLLQIERDSLLEKFSESSDKLAIVSSQKENALKDLNIEVQRRKNLEGEVKQFTAAFVCRQKSLTSLRGDLKTKIEKWRTQTPISVPKSFDGQD
ncbi:putative plus-end-directed kinesin ATPase [Medicago truncatula]|uniref:Kinesin-like protein n=1 Tax=Medicago truncatula TaxID=3880 RepID=A0A072VEY8_MEDTR|nr:kinesin-like protein KIN-7N [Medicago truncatula]KEH40003.1 kinesin motor domain protein [Medicago truncatula]RHN77206.1 putative plus-end-directed kinesin ATPase [Medicago truncatula]